VKIALVLGLAAILAAPSRAQTKPWLEGQHSGVKQLRAVAVQNSQKWNEIWHEHDASTPAPSVDFSKENVVAVFLGQTETAGVKVSVVVQQDPLDANRLNVFYRPVASKKDVAAQVESQPYAIVKVPRAATIDVERDFIVSTPEPSNPPAAPKYDGTKVKALIGGGQNLRFDGD
jgi:hypothetical protein